MQTVQIPLFPIEIFLLPGESSHLHIFEPRYQQLLYDCGRANTGFGIPFKSNNKIQGIGSFVKIKNVKANNTDGTSDIEIICEDVFNLKKIQLRTESKLYPTGEVEFITRVLREGVSANLLQLLNGFLEQTENVVSSEDPNSQLSVLEVAGLLEFSNTDKIKLARTNSVSAREGMLRNRIRILGKIREQMKSIRGDFFLN